MYIDFCIFQRGNKAQLAFLLIYMHANISDIVFDVEN